MNAWQQAREDNNFLESIRTLPIRGATPRVVVMTPADHRKVRWAAARRAQGKPAQIRNASVLGRVASLMRAK